MDECVTISQKSRIMSAGHLVPPVPRQLDPQGPLVSSLNVWKTSGSCFFSVFFANSLVLSCHLQELWLPRRSSCRYQRTGSQNSLANSEKWRTLKVLLLCSLKSWICQDQKYLKRAQRSHIYIVFKKVWLIKILLLRFWIWYLNTKVWSKILSRSKLRLNTDFCSNWNIARSLENWSAIWFHFNSQPTDWATRYHCCSLKKDVCHLQIVVS